MKNLFFLLLFISSCGCPSDFLNYGEVDEDPRTIKGTHPDLRPFIESFEAAYNLNVNVPIGFEDLENTTAGVCRIWGQKYKEIAIDINYYKVNKHNYHRIEQLVYHELGHCVLNLGHDDRSFYNGQPKSIMRSYTFNNFEINNFYIPQKSYYISQLMDKE